MVTKNVHSVHMLGYDPEVNFGITPVKGYVQNEISNVQNLFSRCQRFLGIEKRPIFDQVLLVLQRKKNAQE